MIIEVTIGCGPRRAAIRVRDIVSIVEMPDGYVGINTNEHEDAMYRTNKTYDELLSQWRGELL